MDRPKITNGKAPEYDEKFKLFFENAPLGYQSLDEGGHFIEVNERWTEILGYSYDEVIGKWFGDFLAEPYVEGFRKRFQLFKSLGAIHSEFEMLKKDGSTIFVAFDGRVGYTHTGEFKQTHCILSNITEQKQAEEEILESKAKLEAALSCMADPVFISDTEGRFIQFNEAFARFHKFASIDECARMLAEDPAFLEVFLPNGELVPLDQWSVSRALRGEVGTNAEYTVRRKDTGETWIGSYNFAPILNDKGEIVGSVVTGRDITESKKAEKALANSEERFRSAVMNAPFPIMIHAEDGKVELVNDEWLALTGYSREEIATTLLWSEKAYGINKKIVQEDIEKLYGITGKVDEGEYQIATKSGEIRNWYFSSTPLGKTDDGRRLALSMALDITEQKKAQENLKESEEKFRNFFEYSPVGKSMTGIDGYLRVNKSFSNIVGYSEAELQGMKWQDLTHPEDIDLSNEYTQLLLEGKMSQVRFEKRYLHKNGNLVWTDVSTYLSRKNGQPQFFITTIIDITERKRTEVLLKESEEKYRSLVELSSDAIFINQGNRITYLNRSALKLFGITNPEQLIGKSPFEVFHPDYHEAIKQRIDDMLKKEVTVTPIEEKIFQSDGTIVDVEVAATPFVLKGEPAIQVVLRDITERKIAEEKIRTFSEDLEKQVKQRTNELNETILQLEEQSRVFVGRELRMIELKNKIAELKKQLMDKS